MKDLIQNRGIQNQQVPIGNKIKVHSEMVDVLSKVSPEVMKRVEEENNCISWVI